MEDAVMTSDKYQKLAFVIVSLSHSMTIGIVATVNIAVSTELTWALYPILSIIFAWAIASTAILSKNRKLLVTFFVTSALLIPYLYLLEKLTPLDGWFIGYALPIAIISIITIWVFYFAFAKLRASRSNV